MAERISVIVPAYNIAPWLPRCLDSILAQTYEDLELIVVNDGSTDDTKMVLDDYAAKHDRVKVIHKENGGVTSARLRGVAESTGHWIGFVDGDDEIEPQMYERLLANAHTYGTDISHCGYRLYTPEGKDKFVYNSGMLRQQDNLTGLKDLLDGHQIEYGLVTKLYRRELFVGLEEKLVPDIRINEDLLVNYYLFAKAKKAVYEDFCPYHYILRQGSASYRVLHEHSIFDPIRVRQIILDACSEELKVDASRALMRNCLFAYAQLAMHPKKQYDDFRHRVREVLKEMKKDFQLLSLRNRVLANMICIAPWMFDLAYRLYAKVFQGVDER